MAETSAEVVNKVRKAVEKVLQSIEDENILEYIINVIADSPIEATKVDHLQETVGPFLLSAGCVEDDDQVAAKCTQLAEALKKEGVGEREKKKKGKDDGPRKLHMDRSLADRAKDDASQADWMNFMWGFDKVRKERNTEYSLQDNKNRKEQRRAAKKEAKSSVAQEEDESSEDEALPLPTSDGNGEKDVHVERITIQYKGNELLVDADLHLVHGHRYGLVGRNGIGKTTLLKHIARFDIEGFPRHHRILHVQQEVHADERSVLQTTLDANVELKKLREQEKKMMNGGDGDGEMQMTELYQRLQDLDSDTAESRARGILTGLGFTPEMQDAPTNSLSGGWRMRVAIAAALFVEPDILMLDEPTNHLDLEAVLWLETYLQNYEKTLMIVSHDRKFLDEVITDVVHFYNKQLGYYKGDYRTFEATREERMKNLKKQYEAQMQKRAHMQEFIDKFRYNAKRASLVQSRIKALEKLPRIEEPHEEAEFRFSFPPPEPLGRPIIQVDSVSFGYQAEKPIFKDADFGIDMESRIGIVGPNGAGKSTLLKVILGILQPQSGHVNRHMKLRTAYFTQHHTDQINLDLTAVENMMTKYSGTKDEEVRRHLGRFGVSGDLAMKPCKSLSGGEKSRVAFAILTWPKPHVLIMDEPTNHLDMETIDALILAIRDFAGGVLVVSHDQHFIESCTNELWVVDSGEVKLFRGQFKDYKKVVMTQKKK